MDRHQQKLNEFHKSFVTTHSDVHFWKDIYSRAVVLNLR